MFTAEIDFNYLVKTRPWAASGFFIGKSVMIISQLVIIVIQLLYNK